MYATSGGSGGIPTDPSLQTGKDEEERLKDERLRLSTTPETEATLEQTREEKTINTRLFQKIRRYEEGEGEGQEREFSKIPRLEENMSRLYNWVILLMGYIDNMVNYDQGNEIMRTSRIKVVIQIAANLRERKGTEELIITKQGSGEEYARKVIEFLVRIREVQRKEDKERKLKTKWNVAVEDFKHRGKRGEQDKHTQKA